MIPRDRSIAGEEQARPSPGTRRQTRWLGLGIVAILAVAGGLTARFLTGDGEAAAPPAARDPAWSGAGTPYGIWPDGVVPAATSTSDRTPVTLGVSFSARVDGWVTGLQFYRGPANPGPHEGKLWTADGRELASVTFRDAAATGWLTASLPEPVPVVGSRRYVASYTAPHGGYAADQDALSRRSPAVTADLTADAGVFTYGSGVPDRTWRHSNYYVDVVFRPARSTATGPRVPTRTVSPRPEPTRTPVAGRTATATPATTPTGFPDRASTGVPPGTVLSPYDGPCLITVAGTVIEDRVVDCSLTIAAGGVLIKDSLIRGTVANAEESHGADFTITDSRVEAGHRAGTAIGAADFVAVRVHVTGGNRSINCWRDCSVRDSFVHGQFVDPSGVAHESGIRMGSGSTITGNTILCDAPDVPPDAGCSADLTGYGDFAPVRDNLIQGNLFRASTGGTCAYGGSSTGKPFGSGARNIRFLDNVFERGPTGNCGTWAPVMSFDPTRPGNLWARNRWDDGSVVPPG